MFGRNHRVEKTPSGHDPANIIGLKTLCQWGLQLSEDPDYRFTLNKDFQFIEEEALCSR